MICRQSLTTSLGGSCVLALRCNFCQQSGLRLPCSEEVFSECCRALSLLIANNSPLIRMHAARHNSRHSWLYSFIDCAGRSRLLKVDVHQIFKGFTHTETQTAARNGTFDWAENGYKQMRIAIEAAGVQQSSEILSSETLINFTQMKTHNNG